MNEKRKEGQDDDCLVLEFVYKLYFVASFVLCGVGGLVSEVGSPALSYDKVASVPQ